jgi:hypothetical protein
VVALGVGFFRAARRIRSFWLIVYRDGFVCKERGKLEVFRWDQVACIEETITHEYFPLKMGLKYLFPLGESHAYLIRRRDGGSVRLDGSVVKRLDQLEETLLTEAQRWRVDWQTKEM